MSINEYTAIWVELAQILEVLSLDVTISDLPESQQNGRLYIIKNSLEHCQDLAEKLNPETFIELMEAKKLALPATKSAALATNSYSTH